jgi:hypothetical protein
LADRWCNYPDCFEEANASVRALSGKGWLLWQDLQKLSARLAERRPCRPARL